MSLYETSVKTQIVREWRDVNRLTNVLYQKLSRALNRTFCNVNISASQVFQLSSRSLDHPLVNIPAPSLEGMLVNVLSVRYPRYLKASALSRWREYQSQRAQNRISAGEVLSRLRRKQAAECMQSAFR